MKEKKLIIFLPSVEGGGVEKNFYIISNFLIKKIKKIYLINLNKKKLPINSKIKLINYKFNIFLPSIRIIKIILGLFILIKEIIRDPNLVVFSFQANLYAILVCKIFNIKIIIRSNSSPSGWSTNIIKKNIFKFFFKYPTNVIVNSNDFKKQIEKIFNVNSVFIPNPLNKMEIIKKSKIKLNTKIYKRKNSLKLISIGRLVDQKDHITILKAINLIHLETDVELLIIGRGNKKRLLNKYIENNNLQKSIKIINFKNNPFPYLRISDAMILASKYEGLPNVLLEALTLKKPIISSDCPTGPREILSNGKSGILFNIGDYRDLSQKIKLMRNNYNKFLDMAKFGQKTLERYDKKRNLKKYYELVKKNINS
jgi:glycosyltransferase involved in cell wall biosynthesis